MNMQKTFLSRRLALKYAQAYFNVFGPALTMDEYYAMQQTIQALKKNKQLMALMHISFAQHLQVKNEVMKAIVTKFHLPDNMTILCSMLIKDRRAHMLPLILKKITRLYEEYKNFTYVDITVSHELPKESIEAIQKMLERYSGQKIIPIINKDSTLIAGIRAQSNTFVWEHSIRKYLNHITAQFKR